jgi:hypothetical protein
MRRLLVTLATVAMGLTGSLGLSAMTATHAAASTNVPARGCGWDCGRDRHRCDWWCGGDHRDHRDRCDWRWGWGWDCRRGW